VTVSEYKCHNSPSGYRNNFPIA